MSVDPHPSSTRQDRATRVKNTFRGLWLDTTPLQESRDFRYLFAGQAINLIGSQVRIVTVPYLVYVMTRSNLMVGLLSLAQFGPAIFCSFAGGALADVMDRRRLLLITQVVLMIASGMLTAAAFVGRPQLWYIFAIQMVAAGVNAVDNPTRRAAIPRLVRREQVANALAANQIMMQLGTVLGPTIAGIVLATLGVGPALLIDTVTFGAAIASLLVMMPMPPLEDGSNRKRGFAAIIESMSFLKGKAVVQSTFYIDLNATFFGFPRALFPALALTVFKVGPRGLGLLYAAPGVGALIGAMLSGWVGRIRRQGRATVIAVCVFGVAITAFGLLSHHFWLALVMLAIAYAADQYSAIFRSTILQLAVPDRLRGRLSAFHNLVVSSGPQLGNFESGLVASLTTTEFSVVAGGLISVLGAIAIGLAIPAFMRYDALAEPEPENFGGL